MADAQFQMVNWKIFDSGNEKCIVHWDYCDCCALRSKLNQLMDGALLKCGIQ